MLPSFLIACMLKWGFSAKPTFLASLARDPSHIPGIKLLPGIPSRADNLSIRGSTAMARSQELARLFQQPQDPAQRRYEICRAYFHDGSTAAELATRFRLHVGTVRAIVRDFAHDPDVTSFFTTTRPGRKAAPKREAILERACALRRRGATLADIRAALEQEGFDISESYLFRLLRRAGLTATRHRRPTRRPGESSDDGSVVPDIADVHALSLEGGRHVPTKVAGLFLFLPLLLDLDLPRAVAEAGLPGSEQVP